VVVSVSTDGSAFDRTMAVGVRRYLQQSPIVVLVGLLGVLVAGLAIARPGTVTPGWISSVVLFAAPLGIMAAGQTLVMITGGIDLSVANVATAAAYVMASQASHGTLTAVALALLIGLVVGLVNGAGVAVFKVQPLIMTLGMGLVVTGTLTVYSQLAVKSVPGVPPFIHELGARTVLGVVPVSLFLWAPLAAAVILGLRYSGYGRLLYAVGDNATACRLSGVRVWQVLLVVYALSGLLAAVGGLVLAGSTNAADLSLATIYLLPVVAAVVIGGTSIYGGSGSYSGTIVGALILTVLNSLLTLLDAPDPLKQILYGAIILALAAAYTRVLSEA
jgi:ribose transport system permease protein